MVDIFSTPNIIIGLFANDAEILARLHTANQIFIPSIALGELFYGARNSRRTDENLARIEEFGRANIVLGCGARTARLYGQIKFKLKQNGRPIPENDIWIAALAREYDLIIVSRDRHFNGVDDVVSEDW